MEKISENSKKTVAELQRDEEKLKSMNMSVPWAKNTKHVHDEQKSMESMQSEILKEEVC